MSFELLKIYGVNSTQSPNLHHKQNRLECMCFETISFSMDTVRKVLKIDKKSVNSTSFN